MNSKPAIVKETNLLENVKISELKLLVDGLVCTDLKVVMYGMVDGYEHKRWTIMKKYANMCIDKNTWGVISPAEVDRATRIADTIISSIDKDVLKTIKKNLKNDSSLNSENLEAFTNKINEINISYDDGFFRSIFKRLSVKLNLIYAFADYSVKNRYLKRTNNLSL